MYFFFHSWFKSPIDLINSFNEPSYVIIHKSSNFWQDLFTFPSQISLTAKDDQIFACLKTPSEVELKRGSIGVNNLYLKTFFKIFFKKTFSFTISKVIVHFSFVVCCDWNNEEIKTILGSIVPSKREEKHLRGCAAPIDSSLLIVNVVGTWRHFHGRIRLLIGPTALLPPLPP